MNYYYYYERVHEVFVFLIEKFYQLRTSLWEKRRLPISYNSDNIKIYFPTVKNGI